MWSIADDPISVQLEKRMHSILKQYLKIHVYSLLCAKTIQRYVRMVAVNNDTNSIRVHCAELDYYGIKVG